MVVPGQLFSSEFLALPEPSQRINGTHSIYWYVARAVNAGFTGWLQTAKIVCESRVANSDTSMNLGPDTPDEHKATTACVGMFSCLLTRALPRLLTHITKLCHLLILLSHPNSLTRSLSLNLVLTHPDFLSLAH